ncbi:hypothetical protein M9Y10_043930 [Tritrichomonas musculus]|uniref:Peptidase M1 membrane alanine aminopeptidase domain-containing protein n=1 Tax=Tritrichomonas musculus TaxID=1915356 RepID=A0ABR2K405_9EUKA
MDFSLFNAPAFSKIPAVRLSKNYVPVHYDIFIHPDIPKKTFSGKVEILVKYLNGPESERPHQMELHCDPTIIILSVVQKNHSLKFHVETDGKFIILGEDFDVNGPIAISYVGSLNHKWKGLYYVDENSCCTQFEPNDARKCFPCYDEPWAKATFSISIRHLSTLKALSNMPAISVSQSSNPNESITCFQKTPPMCTYLVAIAVGQFSCLTGNTARGLPVDVYASPENSQYLQFPLEEAIKTLNYLEEYFDMPFDLPRLQILAAKHFMFGGMENYGLIIIVEQLFLTRQTQPISPELSQSERQFLDLMNGAGFVEGMASLMQSFSLSQLSTMMDESTARLVMSSLSEPARLSLLSQVVTHEIVHMWAGDIVSPKWWDSLWLNEGFATLLPSLMFDEYHPEFTFLKLYDDSNNQATLGLDALERSRPVHGNIVSESDSFDMMSYNKAAAVLRMIRTLIGPINFRNFYRGFLKKYEHSCADSEDFLVSLTEFLSTNRSDEEHFNFDVKKFFDEWIFNDGFPLIIIEENFIRQIPFSPGDDQRIWQIPLKILYGKKDSDEVKSTMVFLDKEEMEFNIDCDWLIVNPGLDSFCRVWYVGDWLQNAITNGCRFLNMREKSIFKTDQNILVCRGYIDQEDILLMQSYI